MIVFEIVKSLRLKQWIKNLIIFAPLIFSENVFDRILLLKSVFAFVLFCLVSGAAYILNDIKDLEEDRLHPLKSKRPLASGRLKKSLALFTFFFLVILSLMGAFLINIFFCIALGVYLVLQVSYSFWLKHVVILDVFLIATGFLINGGMSLSS